MEVTCTSAVHATQNYAKCGNKYRLSANSVLLAVCRHTLSYTGNICTVHAAVSM